MGKHHPLIWFHKAAKGGDEQAGRDDIKEDRSLLLKNEADTRNPGDPPRIVSEFNPFYNKKNVLGLSIS